MIQVLLLLKLDCFNSFKDILTYLFVFVQYTVIKSKRTTAKNFFEAFNNVASIVPLKVYYEPYLWPIGQEVAG